MRTLVAIVALAIGMTAFPNPARGFLPAASVQAGDFSKEDLKKLLAAKLSDATIIAYIKRNPPGAMVSAEDLIELKTAGADDAVLAALVEASKTPKAAPASPPSPPSGGTVYGSGFDSYGQSGDDYYYYPSYYYYDPYGYTYPGYPGYGFAFRFGIPFRDHDRFRFNHFDSHPGHFQSGPRGAVPHGTFHGGGGSGGGHGGGGHR